MMVSQLEEKGGSIGRNCAAHIRSSSPYKNLCRTCGAPAFFFDGYQAFRLFSRRR